MIDQTTYPTILTVPVGLLVFWLVWRAITHLKLPGPMPPGPKGLPIVGNLFEVIIPPCNRFPVFFDHG